VLGKTLAEFNRGAAAMEQYQYAQAATAFENVLQAAPDWIAARFNLGLARLNLLGESKGSTDLDAARVAFDAVLAVDPNHLSAQFCLGMYYQHLGDMEKAVAHFRAVYDKDRDDPYVAYKYSETLRAVGQAEEAGQVLEKLVDRNPGFLSAVYAVATQYMRSGQRDKAMPLFERFKKLSSVDLNPSNHSVQQSYGSAGKYYLALGVDNLPLPKPRPETGRRVVFSPETKTLDPKLQAWKWPGGSIGMPGIAVADIDGDGDLDLCLTGLDERGSAAILRNGGGGKFVVSTPLADGVVAACFGDVDNDGTIDLWLGRNGPNCVLLNDGKGNFRRADYKTVAGPDALTHLARLVDLDSDGDLDLLAFRLSQGSVPAAAENRAAASSLFSNNGDGTFADQAAALGLALADKPVAAVVCDDFDNDRDLDLVLFPATGTPLAWVNHRLGEYRLLDAAATGLQVEHVLSANAGDPDKDGNRDLLVFTTEGMQLFRNDGHFHFRPDEDFAARCGALGGTGGQFVDIDNDGDLDIFLPDARRRDGSRGPVLLINQWPENRFVDAAEIDPGIVLAAIRTAGAASGVAADFTGDGRCDLLIAEAGKQPLLLENATPGGHWIELDLAGKRPQDNKSRSNNSAIGARVDVKSAGLYQQFVVGDSAGPTAIPPLRIHAGLGEQTRVDWLRILWPDAVLQAEMELAADRVVPIEELQRKTSSCPYLFAWTGQRFEFVADFGGVGGLGFMIGPRQYATPDPTEYIRIPRLEPRDGQYVLQSLTPLEEVTYFDEAQLIAVDHPQGTQVYPHEMMAIGVPPPEFRVFCIGQPIDPVRAVDHRGRDVTDAVLKIDRVYAGATAPDRRFLGLAEEHFVELDFGDRLEKLPDDARLVLFLHGWVEYGYSATNFAASQAGLRAKAPTISVQRDGRWVELLREVGYPAGLNHTMTVDLSGQLRRGDRVIRVGSNMELYWDRIFLGQHLTQASLHLTTVPPASADLHFRGYPREFSPDGRLPNLCDYENFDRTVGWKLMSGQYTRFGEVGELLRAADDCFVIMGHGEELTLRFPAAAFGRVPEGCCRTFLLKTDSYCKDMDLYTAHPDTVEPLPFHGMSGYPYGPGEHYPETERTQRYRAHYNTRTIHGR
jgi:tetratricopeptide (TPR) repeat protein